MLKNISKAVNFRERDQLVTDEIDLVYQSFLRTISGFYTLRFFRLKIFDRGEMSLYNLYALTGLVFS